MGTKTIGLREEVYGRLKARQREDESLSDLVDRLVEERRTDWREGFGTLPDGAAETLEDAASRWFNFIYKRSAPPTPRYSPSFRGLKPTAGFSALREK